MTNLENYSGFDKAAILLQILGEQLAMPLFDSISESDMLKLRVRSIELQHTPTAIKKLIMEEYYFKMMSNQYRNKPEPDDVFKFIRDLNDEQIFYLLSKEEVKIIALAIEQITPERQMKFLDKLDIGLKNKVIIQIGNLNDIPLEAVVDMARELENKAAFIPGPKEFSRGGGKSIATILSNLPESEAKQYLAQVQSDDPALYAEIKKHYISFDDLINSLPEGVASEFWSNPDLDVDLMAKALKGYENETVNRVVEFLPQKKQAMFSPIETPVAKREVEGAQSQILNIAKDKISSGEWNLEDILGEGEFIE
jgi:flagellar motor switch protein FliG